jgi:hypothetical protein
MREEGPMMRGSGPVEIEIIVIRTPRGYQVNPACPVVSRDDQIVWRNYTGADIEVLLPRVLSASVRASVPLVVAAGNEARVTVTDNRFSGFHPYAVYSAEANDMAVGNSSPGVIIRR